MCIIPHVPSIMCIIPHVPSSSRWRQAEVTLALTLTLTLTLTLIGLPAEDTLALTLP